MSLEDLEAQPGFAQEIWFIPEAPGVEPHYSFLRNETKRYFHLWTRTEETTWGWVLHESAVLVWRADGSP